MKYTLKQITNPITPLEAYQKGIYTIYAVNKSNHVIDFLYKIFENEHHECKKGESTSIYKDNTHICHSTAWNFYYLEKTN